MQAQSKQFVNFLLSWLANLCYQRTANPRDIGEAWAFFGEPMAIGQNTGKRGDGPKGYHLLMSVMIGWNGISN
jgi:hypothetical protein